MADAKLVELAKQVVTDLNAGTFETTFTASRSYVPRASLEDTGTLKVLVTMSGWRAAPDNRAEWDYEYDIDVGVLFRAAASGGVEATTTFDTYVRLLEQISDLFRFTRPAVTSTPYWLETISYGGPSGLPYFPDHIEQFNQFTGVVRLTFRGMRS